MACFSTYSTTPTLYTRLRKKHNLRRVVVFGAGLSKAFGLPLASELLQSVLSWYREKHGERKLNLLYDFLDYFYPSLDRDTSDYPLFEDVLGMLDTAEIYIQIRNPHLRGYKWRHDSVRSVRSRLVRSLTEYLWERQTAALDKSQITLLCDLVRRVGTNAIYITFNYDLLLETALSHENIAYTYTISRKPNVVSVLKPHGSINWFYASEIDTLPSTEHWIKLGSNIIVSRHLDPEKLGFRNWKESVIIPPTPNKQIGLFELKKTWTAFSSAITNTPELLVIGYSLPVIDRLSRLILRRAGPQHSCKKILVVSPGDVEDTFRGYISPTAEFIRERFEKCNLNMIVPKT